MRNTLAILLGLTLASGTALAAGTGDTGAAVDQGQGMESGGAQATQDTSFISLDQDKNGQISRQEAQDSEQLSDNFDDADEDGNGYLNLSEYESAVGQG